jgi:glucose/arabinose dehydrogenase
MKLIKFVLFLLVIVIVSAFAFNIFKRKVGNVGPAVIPNISSSVNTTSLTIPQGYSMSIFADNLGDPRDLEFTPGGTLLVSAPSRGAVYALIDKNGDGKADENKSVLSDLGNPHGLAFYNGKLYVASETKVVRYGWEETSKTLFPESTILTLPKGGRHFTRTLAFMNQKMFVSIGSTCDVCFENNSWNGSVIVSDLDGKNARIFAKGLRNSVFIKINPKTGELWGTEMGRDYLGDGIPPDEINIIRDGKDYGWPICYGNRVYDSKFGGLTSKYCETTEPPIYEIQAHSAPLGLVFINSPMFPDSWQGDLLVSYHGSWNRSVPDGYKVVHLKVDGNKIVSEEDFISGFLQGSISIGRPVDVEFGPDGALYISDDKAGVVYRVWKS